MKVLQLTQSRSDLRDREVLKCVERALTRYDEKLSWIAFSKFEMDYALSKEDIVQRPELFTKTLQQIFRFGSTYVEKALIKELRREFQPRDRHYTGLADAIIEIRQTVGRRILYS
jgi:hypothetical protein